MAYLLNNKNITEENIKIKDIPCILLRPRNEKGKVPTIIFYHGWSSSKEGQRFRGFTLASLGYQVIIPDALYHGERHPINHADVNNAGTYFWKVVLNNIEESGHIINEAINKYNGDPDNIGVIGHSMGGFTAAGVFTHDERVKVAIPLNGSFNWEMSNELFEIRLDNNIVLEEEDEIKQLDPMNNLDKLVDRSILMLNGGADKIVPAVAQKVFYDKLKDLYKDKSNIKLIDYDFLGHFVTTNMMEDAAKWLEIHLR